MKLASFMVGGRRSFGVVSGDGIIDLGRRLEDRCPTLRAAIATRAPPALPTRCGVRPPIMRSAR